MNSDEPGIGRTILDSVAEGVFTVDRNWLIEYFNRGAERITGVPREEAIGSRCCDVFRASICESVCALRHTLETGEPVVNRLAVIIDAKGRKVPISISTSVLRDDRGRLVGGVETFRDLSQVEQLRKELAGRYSLGDIIGRSLAMRDLFGILPAIAASDSTVVIHGASGTGKELFARAIHELSPRREKPFVAINCGALWPSTAAPSRTLSSSPSSSATRREHSPMRAGTSRGVSRMPRGGRSCLTRLGTSRRQCRCVCSVSSRSVSLGGVEPVPADVRVVAATHRDLSKLVEEGSFREDLFYRINVMRLELPSLRERREDIPLLIDHFIDRFNRLQEKNIAAVSDDVLALLMSHDFPGNARELENIIEHGFVLCHSAAHRRDPAIDGGGPHRRRPAPSQREPEGGCRRARHPSQYPLSQDQGPRDRGPTRGWSPPRQVNTRERPRRI